MEASLQWSRDLPASVCVDEAVEALPWENRVHRKHLQNEESVSHWQNFILHPARGYALCTVASVK